MAILSSEELQRIIDSKSSALWLQKREVEHQESPLRLYGGNLFAHEAKAENAYANLINKITKRFNDERTYVEKILEFADFPLKSNDLIESCANSLYKVFSTPDYREEISGNTDSVDLFNVNKFVREVGKEALKTSPSTIVVVDRNEEGDSYAININHTRVIDGVPKDDGSFEYIAFYTYPESEDRISVYDDAFYRVYEKSANDRFNLIIEERVLGGECPASFYIRKPLKKGNKWQRWNAFTPSMGQIEEFSYFYIFKNYADHYYPFPVAEYPDSGCENPNCKDGYVTTYAYEEPELIDDQLVTSKEPIESRTVCTSCNGGDNKPKFGPNSTISVPINQYDSESKPLNDLFKFIVAPLDGVKYISEKIEKLENSIKENVTGKSDVLSREAVNEKQVSGNSEGRRDVLDNIREMVEDIHRWVFKKISDEGNYNLSIDLSYGSEYLIKSEAEIQEELSIGMQMGLFVSELDDKYMSLINTRYKGSPLKKRRAKLIKEIDPFPFDTDETIKVKYDIGAIDIDDIYLKFNLKDLISKLEYDMGIPIEFYLGDAPIIEVAQAIKEKIKEDVRNRRKTKEGEEALRAIENSPEQAGAVNKGGGQ